MDSTTGVRALFSCAPGIGHFYPLLPLARELRRHGHAVAFLTAPGLGAAVDAEGFELLPAGPDLEALVWEAFRRHPHLAALPPDQVPLPARPAGEAVRQLDGDEKWLSSRRSPRPSPLEPQNSFTCRASRQGSAKRSLEPAPGPRPLYLDAANGQAVQQKLAIA
jgi:hypothetical protein